MVVEGPPTLGARACLQSREPTLELRDGNDRGDHGEGAVEIAVGRDEPRVLANAEARGHPGPGQALVEPLDRLSIGLGSAVGKQERPNPLSDVQGPP